MKKIKIDEQNYKIEYKTTEKQRERARIRHALHRDEDNARSRVRYAVKKAQEKQEASRKATSIPFSGGYAKLISHLFGNYEKAVASGDTASALEFKDMISAAHGIFIAATSQAKV